MSEQLYEKDGILLNTLVIPFCLKRKDHYVSADHDWINYLPEKASQIAFMLSFFFFLLETTFIFSRMTVHSKLTKASGTQILTKPHMVQGQYINYGTF